MRTPEEAADALFKAQERQKEREKCDHRPSRLPIPGALPRCVKCGAWLAHDD